MTPWDGIAASAAFVLLAIPVYWLVLHPFAAFWRKRRQGVALGCAALAGWGASGALVLLNFERLFAGAQAPSWARVTGLLLLFAEVFMFRTVARAMGPDRLIGKVEMSGAGQLETTGIYARLRHPSYAGMMMAMLGICLLAGTMLMWALAAAWWVMMRLMIAFEERELLARFGPAYADYRRRVPALLPFRFWPAQKE
jgi:protein-S-isoprenylcysteine O-methyltransferase Ste14